MGAVVAIVGHTIRHSGPWISEQQKHNEMICKIREGGREAQNWGGIKAGDKGLTRGPRAICGDGYKQEYNAKWKYFLGEFKEECALWDWVGGGGGNLQLLISRGREIWGSWT